MLNFLQAQTHFVLNSLMPMASEPLNLWDFHIYITDLPFVLLTICPIAFSTSVLKCLEGIKTQRDPLIHTWPSCKCYFSWTPLICSSCCSQSDNFEIKESWHPHLKPFSVVLLLIGKIRIMTWSYKPLHSLDPAYLSHLNSCSLSFAVYSPATLVFL